MNSGDRTREQRAQRDDPDTERAERRCPPPPSLACWRAAVSERVRRAIDAAYDYLVPWAAGLPDSDRARWRPIQRDIVLSVGGLAAGGVLLHLLIERTVSSPRRRLRAHVALPPLFMALGGYLTIRQSGLGVLERVKLAEQLRAEQARAVRLDGALLVARTTAHALNNALAPVAGYAELLALNPAVQASPQACAFAELVHKGALDAALQVTRIQSLARLEEAPDYLGAAPGAPILDLERSTAPAALAAAPAR